MFEMFGTKGEFHLTSSSIHMFLKLVKRNCNLVICRLIYIFFYLGDKDKNCFIVQIAKETGTETVVFWLSDTGSFRRIQASAVGKMQREAKIEGKKAEKGKIRYKEEELTPPYSFWHHRHPEYMTHDFFHCITGVGGLA